MRIAMLGAKAVPAIGGIAQYIEQVGARLARRGHDVTVYCRPHFMPDEAPSYRGMNRVVTSGLKGKHLDALTHTFTASCHALMRDYDILHIHGASPSIVSMLLQLRPHGQIVTTLHGLDWAGSKWNPAASAVMRTAARAGVAHSDSVTAVSRWVAEQCQGQLGREATFIPTGVTCPDPVEARELQTLGLEPESYIFCCSRLVAEKGVHYLLEAFGQVKTPLKLVIAGSCPYHDPYVTKLQSLADERVIFAGYVKGRLLEELYSNAYLYVQPSENEGLPIAVLEALSYGRCVVASDIPQNQEALGGCGYTFRTRDSEHLAERLRQLIKAPDVVREQFHRSRDYVRRERNWELTTDRYEELYDNLLAGRWRLRLISQTA